jgi:hypothetical protein
MACGFPPDPVRGPTLAAVLQAGLSGSPPSLPKHHWDILNALLACRTPALGGHRYECEDCGKTHFVPHSCRNRHCPVCQGQAAHQWLEKQEGSLLPVPYFHLVFTLPHVLNPVIQQNQAVLYRLLFATASQTLLEFGQNRFGVQLGITAVLHTWSQTLLDHYHLHCIVTGGGLTEDGSKWVSASPHFLFPVRALSEVFRGKFCSGLEKLFAKKELEFHGKLEELSQESAFKGLLASAVESKWVVYAKRPFAGPGQVLAYLSRYTHRVAISPKRVLALDEEKQTVTFLWRDYADGGRRKTMTLKTEEFLRRFCLHLLPERFVKIRHYGFLANRQRQERVTQARALLSAAAPQPELPDPGESKDEPQMVCPHCGSNRVILIEVVEASTASKPAPLDSS